MANVVVSLFSLRRYGFEAIAASNSFDIVVVRALECARYREISLVTRVHSIAFGSGASIQLFAYEVAPTDDEPGTDFVASSTVCSSTITSAFAPALYVTTSAAPFGGALRVVLRGTRGISGACAAVLEADLVMKE